MMRTATQDMLDAGKGELQRHVAATSLPPLPLQNGPATAAARRTHIESLDDVGPVLRLQDGGGSTIRDPDINAPELQGLDMQALQALGAAASPEQAASIARQVADMAQGLAALADRLVGQGAATGIDTAEADCIAFLEGQFRIRRLRARHLVGISLGEPAWDILLDLAVAQFWRRETSVTSLCIAADVPSTTALRWINSMTKAGLIVRRPCLRDGRRSFLAIAPDTYQAMLALAADAVRAADKVRSRYQRSAAA